jgi:tetratricopeptide (TPR) repeat protein
MSRDVRRIAAGLAAFALSLCFALPVFGGGLDLIKQGQEAEKTGNRNAALEAYTRAISAGDLNGAQLAFAYYRRGGIHGFLGNNVRGIEEYSRAIELSPGYGAAYSLRGYLRGTVGQYDLAEKDHLSAIDLAKNQKWQDYLPWVLQHYADLWRRRGEFDKALAYCEKALQVSPYPSAYFRRAWIYLDMGRNPEARADYQRFDAEMQRQKVSYDVFWPDERGAIGRLRELR